MSATHSIGEVSTLESGVRLVRRLAADAGARLRKLVCSGLFFLVRQQNIFDKESLTVLITRRTMLRTSEALALSTHNVCERGLGFLGILKDILECERVGI
jgi:hypothetical protein